MESARTQVNGFGPFGRFKSHLGLFDEMNHAGVSLRRVCCVICPDEADVFFIFLGRDFLFLCWEKMFAKIFMFGCSTYCDLDEKNIGM